MKPDKTMEFSEYVKQVRSIGLDANVFSDEALKIFHHMHTNWIKTTIQCINRRNDVWYQLEEWEEIKKDDLAIEIGMDPETEPGEAIGEARKLYSMVFELKYTVLVRN